MPDALAPTARLPAPAPRVAVLGASGYVGTHLVPFLVQRGAAVRAIGRSSEVLAARQWVGVEIVAADALQPASLMPALAGVETLYYLVHSMAAGARFRQLDRMAAVHVARAARQAGVKRIVYLGGLVPPGGGLRTPGVAPRNRRNPGGRRGADGRDPRRHHRGRRFCGL